MFLPNTIEMVMVFIAFILAMGVHYGAQALMATVLGDTSLARDQRLTINPVRHLAPFGTCVALISSFTFGLPAGIGWGRFIRPDARRLRTGPNAGVIVIALTGLLTNILLGLVISFAFQYIPYDTNQVAVCETLRGGPLQGCLAAWQPGWLLRIEQFGFIFAAVNIAVGLFNLIPLYPLDGYHLLFTVLPDRAAINYRNSEQWQELILAGIIFLLPFLLQFIGLGFSPVGFVQSLGYVVVDLFSHGQFEVLRFI